MHIGTDIGNIGAYMRMFVMLVYLLLTVFYLILNLVFVVV